MSKNVKVVAKAFEVLETLNREPRLSLKEITDRVAFPKPTVFRLLYTLETLGYVEQDADSQTYTLSTKFTSFIDGANRGSEIIRIAQPYMEKLRSEFKETVNLCKLVDNVAVYISILESNEPFRISDSVGDHAAFHSTSVGKAILAFLPEKRRRELLRNYLFSRFTKKTIRNISELEVELTKVRKQGYALDNEEGHEGVFCIGAPIFDRYKNSFTSISISMPKVRAKRPTLDKMKKELTQTAKEISSELAA